ncbi:MAG: hypothetical protein H0T62_08895 [Parachlamydiaceae bacterium]|nr:hypothetical protein [Parachlamydiaceae bacterium]
MKTIFLSSLVLFAALFAFNLEAGQGHNRGHNYNRHHHHHSRTSVNLNVGPVFAPPVARPVVTYVQPAQPVHVVSYPDNNYYYSPEYYPVTTVEYVQPMPVARSRPCSNWGVGFFTGFLTSSVLRAL